MVGCFGLARRYCNYSQSQTNHIRLNMKAVKTENCGTCRFFAQGATCSFCANEKQTNESLKKYAYWIFSCGFYQSGIHDSRVKYMEELNKIK